MDDFYNIVDIMVNHVTVLLLEMILAKTYARDNYEGQYQQLPI